MLGTHLLIFRFLASCWSFKRLNSNLAWKPHPIEVQHDIESAHFVVSFIIFTHERYAPACSLEQLSWTAVPEWPHYSRRMAQYAIKPRRQLQSSRTPQNWRSISLCLQGWITCWLPMYIRRTRLHVCDKWHVASWRHRIERGKLCSAENYWKINKNCLYSGGFKDAIVAYFWLLSDPVGVAANV